MDHFIGNWWSANDADVVPAGDGAKGYKGATFHAPGTSFKVHAGDRQVRLRQGQGRRRRRKRWATPLYNRGRRQRDAVGRGHPHGAWPSSATSRSTSEQVRWGFENLNLTEKRLDQLGMKGFTHPIKVTCEDHEGNGPVLIQQWDGKKWNIVSDWIEPMRDVVRPEDRGGGGRGGQEARLHDARLLEGEVGRVGERSDTPRPLLAVNNIEVIYDHVILVLKGVSLAGPRGGHRRPPRGQRRRQVHHAQGHLRAAAHRARRGDQGHDRVPRASRSTDRDPVRGRAARASCR